MARQPIIFIGIHLAGHASPALPSHDTHDIKEYSWEL
jgi:hypothetical protein